MGLIQQLSEDLQGQHKAFPCTATAIATATAINSINSCRGGTVPPAAC